MKQDQLNKLQKVLKLADHESATPAERELALMRATEMAERMGVELAMVRAQNDAAEKEDAPEEIVKEDLSTKMKEKHGWHLYTIELVANMTGIQWCYTQRKYSNELLIHMVGEKSDVIFAQYLFGYFDAAITRQWEIARKVENLAYSFKKAFWYGAKNTLNRKIREMKEMARGTVVQEVRVASGVEVAEKVNNTRSLMIVEKEERVSQAKAAFFPRLRIGRSSGGFSGSRHSAISAGRAAGANINLPGRPLGNGSSSKLQ